jgi:hypothetical protein
MAAAAVKGSKMAVFFDLGAYRRVSSASCCENDVFEIIVWHFATQSAIIARGKSLRKVEFA